MFIVNVLIHSTPASSWQYEETSEEAGRTNTVIGNEPGSLALAVVFFLGGGGEGEDRDVFE